MVHRCEEKRAIGVFHWRRVRRWPRVPIWMLVAIGVWLAAIGALEWISHYSEVSFVTCPFKLLTGFPCLTCGATRGVVATLQGHPLQGWLYNPMLFTAVFGMGALLTIRLCTGKMLQWRRKQRWQKWLAWTGVILLAGVNWIYVILYVG